MICYSKKESENYSFNGVMDDRVTSLFQLSDKPLQNSHTLRFIRTNCTLLMPFLDKLMGKSQSPTPTAAIVNLTTKVHEEDRRKITGEMYLKHLFYTAYLADEMTKEKEYTPEQRDLIIAVSFLHDTIELKRKKSDTANYNTADFYGLLMTDEIEGVRALRNWDKKDIKKIVTMVSLMTPPDKSMLTPTDEWHEIKRNDFYFLMNITKEDVRERSEILGNLDGIVFGENELEEMAQIIKDVKVAEVLANLRETADDILWSRDGHNNILGMRDFTERHIMFKERVEYFRLLNLDELYVAQMEADMQILNDFVGS